MEAIHVIYHFQRAGNAVAEGVVKDPQKVKLITVIEAIQRNFTHLLVDHLDLLEEFLLNREDRHRISILDHTLLDDLFLI